MSPAPPAVLLVDDETNILSALVRSLRREGWRLLTASSADEALDVLAAETVALVVSDHKMRGGRTGLELLSEVRRRFPGTRRVLLTGWPEEVSASALGSEALDAVLPKPWEDAELKETLRRLVGAGG